MAVTAIACAQATRSTIGTGLVDVWATLMSPGPRQIDGIPASTINVAPSCQFSSPPSSLVRPTARVAASAVVTIGSSSGTSAGGTPPISHSMPGVRGSQGSAAVARGSSRRTPARPASPSRARPPGPAGTRCGSRVGTGRVRDDPFAAGDDGRHAVARRKERVRGRSCHSRRSRRSPRARAPSSRSRLRRRLPPRARAGGRRGRRALDGDRGKQAATAGDPDPEPARLGDDRGVGPSVRAIASPPAPVDSSSLTVFTIRSPASWMPSRASVSAANTIEATPPFMSHAPRP